jgi:hypothetical protein
MKYKEFHGRLSSKMIGLAYVGPTVKVNLVGESMVRHGKHATCRLVGPIDRDLALLYRFAVFPVKLHGSNIRHLNILILDRKTGVLERYDPMYSRSTDKEDLYQTDSVIKYLMHKLMDQGDIYFLKYESGLNHESVLDNNCGNHCIDYATSSITVMALT